MFLSNFLKFLAPPLQNPAYAKINISKDALNLLFFVHFSLLNIFNDMKHIIIFFLFGIIKWCHPKMVKPGTGRTPAPPSGATVS